MRKWIVLAITLAGGCDSSSPANLPDGAAPPGEPTLSLGAQMPQAGAGALLFGVPGDFNGDGKLDVAEWSTAGKLAVANGDGAGALQVGVPGASLQIQANDGTGGDVNGDGKPDVVVGGTAQMGNVFVFLGQPDGSLRAQPPMVSQSLVDRVLVRDLDGDGKGEIITANHESTVSVFPGAGGARADYPLPHVPTALAIADLDGDGKLDLVVGSFYNNPTFVDVFLGTGGGKLAAGASLPIGDGVIREIAIVDLDKDGKLDLVLGQGNTNGAKVSIALGKGDGTFTLLPGLETGGSVTGMVVADFNGGGRLDVATANVPGAGPPFLTLMLGRGDGTLASPVRFDPDVVNGDAHALAPGDFNGDGKPDLFTIAQSPSVILNTSH